MSLDEFSGLTGDDRIIAEAKKRFHACQDWESNSRINFIGDLKFADADSDNGFQWPAPIMQNRGDRPALTINKTRQHNLQIINEAKKNKPSVKVRPTGDEATYDAAQVFEGVIRYIEYNSNAQVAYDTATSFQVKGGIGYWRVLTDYAHDDTFDQEIFIKRIKNPLTVYLDPDINEKDGSDAKFAFIFEDLPKSEFKEKYPQYEEYANQSALGNKDGWLQKDHVRVAEYYRCIEKKDTLIAFPDPETGENIIVRKSKIDKRILDFIPAEDIKKRKIIDYSIEHYLIIGEKIAEKKDWLGRYIPIVRLIGEETVIDGVMDRIGHTRGLKDPQRMYNYNASAAVEYGALQSKSPYVAPAAAIEGYETYWASANTENYSILPYNHIDDDGNPIPAPQRQMPPTGATVYLEGMNTAEHQMMMASGQYEASFGARSNEKSGRAIMERDRQGDDATYHFIDNLGIAIRFTGKILIDLIPKVYDTPRIIKILAKDGTESKVKLDPRAQAPYQEIEKDSQEQEVSAIFNPNVGKYEVEADIGPAYATRRQEAFNAYTQILSQNSDLMPIIGDLLFKNGDFPGADEIAERLARMVPPQAKGDGPSPTEQKLMEANQLLQDGIQKLLQDLAEERLKVKQKDDQANTDAYKAITDRLDVIAKHFEVTAKDKSKMLHDLMVEENRVNLSTEQVNAPSIA